MDSHFPVPPPLPRERKKSRVFLWLGLAVLLLAIAALITIPAVQVLKKAIAKQQQAKQAREGLGRMGEDVKKDLREAFDEETGLSPEKAKAAGDRVVEQMKRAESSLTGDEAIAAQVSRMWLEGFQSKVATYTALIQDLDLENLLAFDHRKPINYADRRAKLDRMLAENAELTAFIERMESDFVERLNASKVSPKGRAVVLAGFRQNAASQRELLLKIRQTDKEIGENAQKILELMERESGKWQFDEEAQMVRFERNDALVRVQELFGNVRKASEEQIDHQRRLVQ